MYRFKILTDLGCKAQTINVPEKDGNSNPTEWTSISGGINHTIVCGLNGELYSWGLGMQG